MTEASPSSTFHAIVKYSTRLPRWIIWDLSSTSAMSKRITVWLVLSAGLSAIRNYSGFFRRGCSECELIALARLPGWPSAGALSSGLYPFNSSLNS